jgi:hypothetical protein
MACIHIDDEDEPHVSLYILYAPDNIIANRDFYIPQLISDSVANKLRLRRELVSTCRDSN